MDGIPSRSNRAGFSLLELMVVLAVVSAFLVVAVPTFSEVIRNAAISSEVNRLITAINFTRSQAVMQNIPVSMCPSANPVDKVPECSGAYGGGWIVFSDSDADKSFDPLQDRLLKVFPPPAAMLTISNRRGTRAANEVISYYPDGSAARNLTLQVCARGGDSAKAWSVILNIVGRPRMAKGWGVCPQ